MLTKRVRETIGRAMMPIAGDVVLLKAGELIPDGGGGYSYGPPTEHPCKGWIADYDDLAKLAAMRPIADRKIVILAGSLVGEPAIGEKVRIGGATYKIRSVSIDPAKAAWALQVYL